MSCISKPSRAASRWRMRQQTSYTCARASAYRVTRRRRTDTAAAPRPLVARPRAHAHTARKRHARSDRRWGPGCGPPRKWQTQQRGGGPSRVQDAIRVPSDLRRRLVTCLCAHSRMHFGQRHVVVGRVGRCGTHSEPCRRVVRVGRACTGAAAFARARARRQPAQHGRNSQSNLMSLPRQQNANAPQN